MSFDIDVIDFDNCFDAIVWRGNDTQIFSSSFIQPYQAVTSSDTTTADVEFDQVGAPLEAARVATFFPRTPQSKSKDWVVAEMAALVQLFGKYQQAAMSLSTLTKRPSEVATYRVNTAASHYVSNALVFAQRFGPYLPKGENLVMRIDYLMSFFKFSWRFFAANKSKHAAFDIEELFKTLPVDSDDLLKKMIVRDNQGARFGLANIKNTDDLKNKTKNAKVEALVFDIILYIQFTCSAFSGRIVLREVTDETFKSLTKTAIKQAGLFLTLFALTLSEVKTPTLLVDSLRLSDELSATTQKLALQLQALPGVQTVKDEIDYDIEKLLEGLESSQPEPTYERIRLSAWRGSTSYSAMDPNEKTEEENPYGMIPEGME